MSFGRRETESRRFIALSGESRIVFDADPHYVPKSPAACSARPRSKTTPREKFVKPFTARSF